MSEKIIVTINGKQCEATKGEFVLEVARRNNIIIPTLCHHKGLAEQGCCRICIVEVNEGSGNKVVVSCVYPITRTMEVFTESEKIQRMRRTILSMLRGRAPEAVRIRSLNNYYKVPENRRFTTLKGEKCILCGLCTRACEEIGTGAISTVSRGISKKVSTPYDEVSPDCVGCLSCASVCPTKAIGYEVTDHKRKIWNKEFELVVCTLCGKPFATAEELLYAQKKASLNEDALTEEINEYICQDCRQHQMADVLAKAFGIGV